MSSTETQDDAFESRYTVPRRITVQDFHRILKAQDVERREDLEFICPGCGTVQSAQDLIDAGAGDTFEDVASQIAFSCVGRHDPERGCDWTLGGLLQIHDLVVVQEDGTATPRFLPANFEEAVEELGIDVDPDSEE